MAGRSGAVAIGAGGIGARAVGKVFALGLVGILVAACSGDGERLGAAKGVTTYSPRVVAYGEAVPKGGGYRKLGRPYYVGGVRYTPRHEPDYGAPALPPGTARISMVA